MSSQKFDKFLYSSEFFSSASVINVEDEDCFFAKASLDNLRGLLPSDIDPQTSPDILYLAANGAVAGMCNANGDAITVETALEVLKFTKNKYFNVDHKKDKVVGFVIQSGASEFGESRLLTESEAARKDVFNLAVVGGVWRAVNKDLVKLLVESSDPSSINFHKVSLSWEIFFNNFDIAVGSKIIKEARIIEDEKEKEKYKPYLKKFGGSGKIGEDYVYRVVKNTNGPENPNVIIGGYSFVINPAATVKGIEVIESGNLTVKNEGESSQASEEWKLFGDENKSLNIPRSEMPQIKSAYRGALVQFLKGRGINYVKVDINPTELKPTQAEYSPKKVKQAVEYTDGNRSILISSDNYIIDGHHQWLAALKKKDETISVIKFDKQITDVLSVIKDFPSIEISDESLKSALAELDKEINLSENSNASNISQPEIISVSPTINSKTLIKMENIKTSSDIAANWEAICKLEGQAGVDLVVKAVRDEIMKASEDWCEKAKAEVAKREAAEAAVAEAQKCAKEAKAALDEMKAQMDQIKASEMQRAAAEKYNERMAEIECEYELEDEERQMVAAKIKDMCDEGYAGFKKEMAVMCKEKSKAFKKAQAETAKLKAEAAAEQAVASTQKSKEEVVTEALASAAAVTTTILTPGLDPVENVMSAMKNTFAAGVKVRGAKK